MSKLNFKMGKIIPSSTLILYILFLSSYLFGISFGANFETSPLFEAQVIANISRPRGITIDEAGDILVVSRANSQIFALYEGQNSIISKSLLINGVDLELDHGVAYYQNYIYASNSTRVFRWAYNAGSHDEILAPGEIVVTNIPELGNYGHGVRALAFDTEGRLYITVGSNLNIDPDSRRARIRRVDLTNGVPDGGFDFEEIEVFADGLRNSVGIGFDLNGVLWGVNNGASFANTDPEEIYHYNPSEELNKFDKEVGSFYGYPYCYSTYNLTGYETNTQLVWPSFANDGIHSDAWCQNSSNNNPPELSMRAHSASLGITFYDGIGCENNAPGAFPCEFKGDAFIAFHGSSGNFLGLPGYKVSRFVIDKETGSPTGEEFEIIYDSVERPKTFRPVGLVFNKLGHLYLTTDVSSEVYRVTYNAPT